MEFRRVLFRSHRCRTRVGRGWRGRSTFSSRCSSLSAASAWRAIRSIWKRGCTPATSDSPQQAGAQGRTRRLTGMSEAAAQMRISDEVAIQIVGMHKWYGEFHVLKDINLTANRGERIVICGPSGSGKSTMIRCVNRLEEHQKGKIFVDDIELTHDVKNIAEIRREVGMVFQHFNLLDRKSPRLNSSH